MRRQAAAQSCNVVASGTIFEVDLPGIPQPKGSARAFRRGSRIIVTSDNPKLKGWAKDAAWACRLAWGSRLPLRGAVRVRADCRLPKPKKPKAAYPITRPDADKLARSCGDVLTGIAIYDDAAIVEWHIVKRYVQPGEVPGVWVRMEAIG